MSVGSRPTDVGGSAGVAQRLAVSAVVVNYRKPDLLLACLESLGPALRRVTGETETIVVDNGSGDDSCTQVERSFLDTVLVALPENVGYPGAVNAGVSRASGEFLLVVNNDLVIEQDAVAELLEWARRRPDVGSLAAQMRFANGGGVLNSAGITVDRLGVSADRLIGEPVERSEEEPVEVFGACGGAALYRRSMWEELGGLDESFFVFLEDVDLSWRAQMAGWRSLYVPSAVVHHHHSATAGHGSALKHWHVGRNRVRVLAKNMDGRALTRTLPRILLYDLGYVAYAAVADRTLAPLRGRVRGILEWREYRRRGDKRRAVALAPVSGLRAALRRRSATARSSVGAPERPPTLTGARLP
jgi:GT2 family glycosyltransferase